MNRYQQTREILRMPTVNISDEAMGLIRAAAEKPLRSTALRREDGTWDVPLARDTYDKIVRLQHAGETMSDTLVRAFSIKQGGLN